MIRRARLTALVPALGLLVVVPAASAASSVSIGSSLQLVSKLYVNVPVTYSCTAFAPGPYTFSSLGVSLEQTNDKALASGSGFISPLCDGATHTATAAVYPSISSYTSTGIPFKSGAAVASASVSDCTADPTTWWIQTCDNASMGPVTVKISSGNA
jgi:hypothetical protein